MTAVHALAMEAGALSDGALFQRLQDAVRQDHQALDRLAAITDAATLRERLAEEAPVVLSDEPAPKKTTKKAKTAGGEG